MQSHSRRTVTKGWVGPLAHSDRAVPFASAWTVEIDWAASVAAIAMRERAFGYTIICLVCLLVFIRVHPEVRNSRAKGITKWRNSSAGNYDAGEPVPAGWGYRRRRCGASKVRLRVVPQRWRLPLRSAGPLALMFVARRGVVQGDFPADAADGNPLSVRTPIEGQQCSAVA